MAIKTKYLIGERFKNNDEFEYEIIDYCESNRKRKVRFDSGYETILSTNSIIKGNMKDFGQPTVFGVGIVGFKNASNHPLYWRWVNMIGRCYSEKHIHYKSYGAKGIKVEPYLLSFKNYVEFISALDNYSEKVVQDSLEKLAEGRTTFTIAHRLTTIKNADEILVLTENGIEEKGIHSELIKSGGLYSEMYSMYMEL